MKRRGFLGFLAGGAVAGPSMAKQAVAGLADLALPGAGISGGYAGETAGWKINSTGSPFSEAVSDWRLDRIAKLGLRTAAQHAFHKSRTSVHALDADLASYRSFSLGTKIRIQQDRNYWKEFHGERSWLEAQIAGFFD